MTPYIKAAIERELDAVRSAPPGAKRITLHKAAYALAGLPNVDLREIEELLVVAAVEAGFVEAQARGLIRRSMARGAAHPRAIPKGTSSEVRLAPVPRSPVPPANYPPEGEVLDLFLRSRPVTEDSACSEWLLSRWINPEVVALWKLARALPSDGPLPSWACRKGKTWRESGHLCLLPLFDAHGDLRSVKARSVHDTEPKELAPSGYAITGLVFACVMGRRLLAGGVPEWWEPEIVVVEGTPDFLTWAARQSDANENGPVIFGVGSGSWSAEIAQRIPTGAGVYLRGHLDEAGIGYMKKVADTLVSRCAVYGRTG